jgi:thiol-disulfide isomerase/thioredoxin
MCRSSLLIVSLSCAVIALGGCNREPSTSNTPAKAQPTAQAPGAEASHEAMAMNHGEMAHQGEMAHEGEMAHQGMSAEEMEQMKVPYTKPPLLKAPDALVGASLPALPLVGADGESSKLSIVDAKPTVVLMWSTWCKACLHETDQITKWAKSRDDVSVLAVNINGISGEKPDVAKVRSYANELGLSKPIWITDADNLSSMGVRTCPTTFVVDTKGVVQAAHEGYKGAEEMNHWLDTSLKAL